MTSPCEFLAIPIDDDGRRRRMRRSLWENVTPSLITIFTGKTPLQDSIPTFQSSKK